MEELISWLSSSSFQWALVHRSSGNTIGLVQLYDVDFRSSRCGLSLLLSSDHQRASWPLEGAILAVQFAFARLALRKVYVETFGGAPHFTGEFASLEALLPDNDRRAGQRVERTVHALHRRNWDPEWALKVTGNFSH